METIFSIYDRVAGMVTGVLNSVYPAWRGSFLTVPMGKWTAYLLLSGMGLIQVFVLPQIEPANADIAWLKLNLTCVLHILALYFFARFMAIHIPDLRQKYEAAQQDAE